MLFCIGDAVVVKRQTQCQPGRRPTRSRELTGVTQPDNISIRNDLLVGPLRKKIAFCILLGFESLHSPSNAGDRRWGSSCLFLFCMAPHINQRDLYEIEIYHFTQVQTLNLAKTESSDIQPQRLPSFLHSNSS